MTTETLFAHFLYITLSLLPAPKRAKKRRNPPPVPLPFGVFDANGGFALLWVGGNIRIPPLRCGVCTNCRRVKVPRFLFSYTVSV